MHSFPMAAFFRRARKRRAANGADVARRKKTGRLHVWIDIPIRIALGLFFAFSAGVYFKNAFGHMREADWAHFNAATFVDGLSVFAIGLYVFLIACLYALRLRPVNRFAGVVPLATALLGGFLMFGLLYLEPRYDLPLGWKLFANSLILVGNIFAIMALAHLGRSFSIIPEARRLVTTGPYRFVRHPLYVAEAVAVLGAMINFLSPAAVALVVVQLAMQLGRIHYEERVLRETFPEYGKYSKRTARLIPGVY